MVTQLVAGGNTSLTADNPLLKELVVGFGWNVISSNGPAAELVPSAIMCGEDGKAVSDDHFVFFNQLAAPDGSVQYVQGDDQEQIDVNLALVPEKVAKIVFVVYVDPDVRKPRTFSAVRNSYVRVADKEDRDIVRYNVDTDVSQSTAVVFGELYRYKGAWKFRALGQGYSHGLQGVAKDFGVAL